MIPVCLQIRIQQKAEHPAIDAFYPLMEAFVGLLHLIHSSDSKALLRQVSLANAYSITTRMPS